MRVASRQGEGVRLWGVAQQHAEVASSAGTCAALVST